MELLKDWPKFDQKLIYFEDVPESIPLLENDPYYHCQMNGKSQYESTHEPLTKCVLDAGISNVVCKEEHKSECQDM